MQDVAEYESGSRPRIFLTIFYLFYQKPSYTKDVQAPEASSPTESSSNNKFLIFSFFGDNFGPARIRIQSPSHDPDPNPLTQLNPDPEPLLRMTNVTLPFKPLNTADQEQELL
jgi:hypothetical protein